MKKNHANLYEDVRLYFENECVSLKESTKDKGHGRIETRQYFLETKIDWLFEHEKWAGLSAIGMVKSTVDKGGDKSFETRYFLTSLTDIDQFSRAVRNHWSIENNLHWQLDVTFGEDSSRFRKGNSAAVWNVLRKTALEYLKQCSSYSKASIKSRRRIAGWDNSYLESVLSHSDM